MSEELKKGIPKAKVIGKVEFTTEDNERHEKEFSEILRQHGVLKDGQNIKELKSKN